MAEQNDIKLSKKTQDLINQVNHFFPGNVEVQFIGNSKLGYVRHDQAQTMQVGNKLIIQVADETEPDFVASHELLHLLMTLRGFPQIYFPLTTGDKALDEQLMYMGTELFDTVCHFVVYSEQRKHGLINEKIDDEFVKGIRKTIMPEVDGVDNSMPLRLVVLLDALVYLGDRVDKFQSIFIKNFPESFETAQKLYKMLTEKPIDSPFSLRRSVVKLFREFDKQMSNWKLPSLHLNDFVMLTSVFSERQLKLQVKQVFKLYHSELKDRNSNDRAYVGFTKSDDQNSFVTTGPLEKKSSEKYINEIYDKTVKEVFSDLHIPYLIR